MIQWLRSLFTGNSRAKQWAQVERGIRARYDAAQTTDENKNHWSNVDYLSAVSANDAGVRQKLKARAGYEISNNCWARGIVNRRVTYLIGRGPRLQCKFDRPEDNAQLQSAWGDWCAATGFFETLRTMALAKGGRCGEAFASLRTNFAVPNPVKLYVHCFESDQCATPNTNILGDAQGAGDVTAVVGLTGLLIVDGVELDVYGNPSFYHILKYHPGTIHLMGTVQGFDRVPAREILHWFRKDRPNQVRGIPEVTPGLDLFGQLRRYTMATLMAAEIAASYALFIKTTGSAENVDPVAAMSTEGIHRGIMTATPMGWDVQQLKAEQPTTTFDAFEHALLVQLCSVLDIPFGIAIGDFSGSSYAGGRLDTQGFFKTIQVERMQAVDRVVEPVFNAWLLEASRVPGLLPEAARSQPFAVDRRLSSSVPHVWRWDSLPHIDIKKEIDAYQVAVQNNFCTQGYVSMEVFGQDGTDVIYERGREVALENEHGVAVVIPGAPPPASDTPTDPPAVEVANK